jgi:transglutaminase-like putative cysteine protease
MRTGIIMNKKQLMYGIQALVTVALCIFLTVDAADSAFDQVKNSPGTLRSSMQIDVKNDGTAIIHEQHEIVVHSRDGVRRYGVYTQRYNPTRERFRVLRMETRNGKDVKSVQPDFMEDKPIASGLSGFDDLNQFKAAFPDVREGSVLVVETRREIYRAKVPGVFEYVMRYAGAVHLEKAELKVSSELPLFWKVNDRWGMVDAKHEKKDGLDLFYARNKYPSYFRIVNETRSIQTDEDLPYVAVSTVNDWGSLGRSLSTLWEPRLSKPLPELFQNIATNIASLESDDAKIDTMLNLLSERLRYYGDWRPVDGSDVPRPLEVTASQGFGDCKDFAAASIAILRHAGLSASPAFIDRDKNAPTIQLDVPLLDAFNHAVVFARGKDGRGRWFDPTNAFRPSSLIPTDIADRPALLIDGDSSRIVRTPVEESERNIVESNEVMHDLDNGWVKFSLARKYRGNPAFDEQRRIVFKKIDYAAEVEAGIKSAGFSVRDFRMLSKIPQTIEKPFDFDLRIAFSAKNVFYRTGDNIFYILIPPPLVFGVLSVEPETREASFDAGHVGMDYTELKLESWRVVGSLPESCHIDTPWYSIRRAVSVENAVLVVRDTAITKKGVVPVAGLRSEAFTGTIEKMRDCFMQVGVIIQKKN